MLIKTYNQKGEEIGQTRLPSEIFNISVNPDLINQAVVSQMASRRMVIAKTKDRGEVRGGGKKPWRQKGTGRARHGSTRSPLWRHGGVTFGPTTNRNFAKKINKKMKRLALLMALSSKAKDGTLVVLEELKIEQPKTKLVADILNRLPIKKGSYLIGLPKKDEILYKASRNISRTKVIEIRNLNILDLLSFKYLIIPKEAIKVIKETFLKILSPKS
jgi:large subunit ribosomal protein L4